MFIILNMNIEYIKIMNYLLTFNIEEEEYQIQMIYQGDKETSSAWIHPPSGQQYGQLSSPPSPPQSPRSGWWHRISGSCLVQMIHHVLLNK